MKLVLNNWERRRLLRFRPPHRFTLLKGVRHGAYANDPAASRRFKDVRQRLRRRADYATFNVTK